MNDKRIIDLEIKYTQMEDLLDQLNQIVTTQQFAIEKLEREVLELKLASSSGNSGERNLVNEKPPHY